MAENLDVLNTTVSLLVKAALFAARLPADHPPRLAFSAHQA
jgi:hypothetical protein